MDQLDKVIKYILNNKCVLFVGAGISKIAGCGDWNWVVKQLIKHLTDKNKIHEINLENSHFSNDKWIEYCLEIFRKNDSETEFINILRSALYEDPQKFQQDYIPLIRKIREIKPFPEIITTNIDNCLEKTRLFSVSTKIYFERKDFIIANLNGEVIFHIHGYIEKFEEALWTRSKYIPQYSDPSFKKYLIQVFSENSTIFLGYGLNEDVVTDIMLEAKKINSDIEHFALIPKEDNISNIGVLKELYGINVIEYGERKDLGNELNKWIDRYFKRIDTNIPQGEASSTNG